MTSHSIKNSLSPHFHFHSLWLLLLCYSYIMPFYIHSSSFNQSFGVNLYCWALWVILVTQRCSTCAYLSFSYCFSTWKPLQRFSSPIPFPTVWLIQCIEELLSNAHWPAQASIYNSFCRAICGNKASDLFVIQFFLSKERSRFPFLGKLTFPAWSSFLPYLQEILA